MKSGDKRLIKKSGIYDTREQLIEACEMLRKEGLNNRQISERVQVSTATVSRIFSGDKKTYNQSTNAVDPEAPVRSPYLMSMFNKWKPPSLEGIA